MQRWLHDLTVVVTTVTLFFYLIGCAPQPAPPPEKGTVINTAHLDALYDQLVTDKDTVGFIHIYAEYPDYHLVGDADEGIACVDDASRAAIFYLQQYEQSANPEYLRKGRMLIRFLLSMQAPNGYYYNFIWPDGRIHTEGPTTRPEPNFWSWRTLWAFGEAIRILPHEDLLVDRMRAQREKLVTALLSESAFASLDTDTTMGWVFPTWLPKVCGTDQAAIVLIGLTSMLQQDKFEGTVDRKQVILLMRHFAEGLMKMQVRDPGSRQDGAFLSWENIWHAYANVQAYSLLTAGPILKDTAMLQSALYEVKTFYPSIRRNGWINHFSIRMEQGKTIMNDSSAFPQIAYGVRPMVWASLKAYMMTGDNTYLVQARELAQWFSGKNDAHAVMYDPATGRGFDGIQSPDQINKNAGAESTIESLLSLQMLEKIDH